MPLLDRVRRKSSIAPEADSSTRINSHQGPRLLTRGFTAAFRIHPDSATDKSKTERLTLFQRITSTVRTKPRELAGALYYWSTCLCIIILICSQLLGAVWDSRSTVTHTMYGRDPFLGPSQIVGTNDVPYPDRVIACVGNDKYYEPRLVSSLLADPGVTAIVEDSSGTAIHGYRLRERRVGSVSDSLDSVAQAVYESSCALIASTLDHIVDGCLALGYTNLTLDNLRVVDNWDSNNLYLLPNTLPVLIMPYWDNAPYARHAIPTWGGDSCIFRLEDAYSVENTATIMASFRGVNQTVRHERTHQWLQRPGGVWKNGWYEDPEGMKWYSDVTSSIAKEPFDMAYRLIDMRTGEERDCSDRRSCEGATVFEGWGDKLSAGTNENNMNSVYIANGSEWGFFIYECDELLVVRSVFDWETLLSNLSVGMVLIRWVLALIALHIGAFRGTSQWFGGGLGCISGSSSFAYLPFASLPRLKITLAAFWTVGCTFEGQQIALSESWFVIYPAIVHLMLIYYSLLNLLAKALRRRVTDVLFTPTVIVFSLMHYFRQQLASSGWLEGVDGREITLVFSDEVNKVQLADYFTTDISWRMNGGVTLLYAVKMAILAMNALPLLLSPSFPIDKDKTNQGLHGIERALGLRARHIGGLGRSFTYIVAVINHHQQHLSSRKLTRVVTPANDFSGSENNENSHQMQQIAVTNADGPNKEIVGGPKIKTSLNTKAGPKMPTARETVLVNSYELTRLGHVVYGDKYLIAFDEWIWMSPLSPLRSIWVLAWTLCDAKGSGDAELAGGRSLESIQPQLLTSDDPRFRAIHWSQVCAYSIQS